MNGPAKAEVGGIADFQNIGCNRWVVLDDIDHLLSRGFWVVDQLDGSLKHHREGGEFSG
jgi:hypothetical protein